MLHVWCPGHLCEAEAKRASVWSGDGQRGARQSQRHPEQVSGPQLRVGLLAGAHLPRAESTCPQGSWEVVELTYV